MRELIFPKLPKILEICKNYFTFNKKFEYKYTNAKKYCRFRDHCYFTCKFRASAHSIYILEYRIPKEITVIFHNGSNYDYYFIMKELAKEIKGQFNCLGENT